MSDVGVNAGFHALDDLVNVLLQISLVVGGYAGVLSCHFVFDEVLTHDEVVDGIARDEL